MLKKNLVRAGLVAALSIAGTVHAAPYLFADTGVQLMEDQDWETLLRLNATTGKYEVVPVTPTTVIQQGDLFAGVFKIQSTVNEVEGNNTPVDLQGTNSTFTSIFLIEATSVVGNIVGTPPTTIQGNPSVIDGIGDTLNFGPTSAANWQNVFGTGGAINISGVLNLNDLNGDSVADGLSTGTMALLFNGVIYQNATQGTVATTLSQSATSFVQGGTLQYEFGYTGVQGATEFWTTTGIDAALIGYAPGTTNKPQNVISLNVTQQWAGPDLAPHNYRLDGYLDGSFTGPAQLQGIGSVSGIVATTTPWGVITDTDLWIKPVPEPGTLALLALGFAGLGFAGRGRKAS